MLRAGNEPAPIPDLREGCLNPRPALSIGKWEDIRRDMKILGET